MTSTIPIHAAAPQSPYEDGVAPPLVLVASAQLFATRAARLEQLSQQHSLRDWLAWLARLARAQQHALERLSTLPLPSEADMQRAREHHMPPLFAALDSNWVLHEVLPLVHTVLQGLVSELREDNSSAMPTATQAVLQQLAQLPPASLPTLVAALLGSTTLTPTSTPATSAQTSPQLASTDGAVDDATRALLPGIGAALQVVWSAMAQRLGALHPITVLDVSGVCPCCGFLPGASVLKTAGGVAGLRYLVCALCATEWNLVRSTCASCGAQEGVSYHSLQASNTSEQSTPTRASPASVRGETCDACKGYLKLVDAQQGAEPLADDLASLTLDLLLDEAGYARLGANLLFVPQ